MFESTGKLRYGKNWRLVLDIDPQLTAYYRSFIPKHIRWNVPKHYPHITVVRGQYETPKNKNKWLFRKGQKIHFKYDPYIKFGELYIWLDAFSEELEDIRCELGLDKKRDRFKCFHITIANMKKV
jgi:hypothetical protein